MQPSKRGAVRGEAKEVATVAFCAMEAAESRGPAVGVAICWSAWVVLLKLCSAQA